MIKRKNEPYKGFWAFPGGFVEYGETVEEAALREVREETGLEIQITNLLGVYSKVDRDPRFHVVTICYVGHWISGELKAETDAIDVSKFTIHELTNMKLAFDHNLILDDIIKSNHIKD